MSIRSARAPAPSRPSPLTEAFAGGEPPGSHVAIAGVSIALACNLVGILHGAIYASLAIVPSFPNADRPLLFAWAAIVLVLAFPVLPAVLVILLRPIVRTMSRATPDPVLRERAQRRALNLPSSTSRTSMILWITAGLSFLPTYALLRPTALMLPALHVAVATILVGNTSLVLTYYGTEWYARRWLLPRLFPEGHLSRVAGTDRVSIRFRMLVLILTSCGVPIIVLTLAGALGVAATTLILYLGTTFLAFGALQGIAIAHSVSDPIGAVAAEMEKVRRGDLTARAPVTSVDEVGTLAEGFNAMVDGLRQAEVVRESFGRYVSPEVLERVLRGEVELGGRLIDATVLSMDIRGFTPMCEASEPATLVARLNRYLDAMVSVVVARGGRIDKFIGDAIMAVFGAPDESPDHARKALLCGQEMLRRLDSWNQEEAAAGHAPWRAGIGIHSGPLIAGNIGSARKLEYAVIGDVVNSAARIEALTRELETDLLISEPTRQRIGETIPLRAVGPTRIRGRREPIMLYALA